jgi:hypothetical protein
MRNAGVIDRLMRLLMSPNRECMEAMILSVRRQNTQSGAYAHGLSDFWTGRRHV